MSDEPKKATDLLIEMNEKINLILGTVRNQDNLIKILINKLSKVPAVAIPVETASIQFPNPMQISDEVKNEPENVDDFTFTNIEQTASSEKESTVESLSNNKVAVQQQIVYNDGKSICLASVEIFDSNNKSIKKLKTNAMGKWMAVLMPGNYTVKVTKSGNNNKHRVELSNSFSVLTSEKFIELPKLSE